MKKLLIILFAIFSGLVYAADNAGFAVHGEKVYSPTLTGAFLLYTVAPDRLAGWSGQLADYEKNYIPQKYQDLPMFGGWSRDLPIDAELLAEHDVTKAFVLGDPEKLAERIEELKKLGLEVLVLNASHIEEYIPLYRELGNQLGLPERGNELAAFGEEMLTKTRIMTKDIPDSGRVSVYVGSGSSALSAMCSMDTMEMAGGRMLYECPAGTEESLTFEQLAQLDPEIIFTTNPASRKVMENPQWHTLTAYKSGQLYVAPHGPLGWLHHFTPFTRFIGAPWLTCKLHPDKCSLNIETEAKRYYKLFLHMDLTDQQLKEILYRYN